MSAFAHTTVLRSATVDLVAPKPHGIYVDCTLGGGGHSEELLQRESTLRVIGLDRDPTALAAARERLAQFGERITFVHSTFGQITQALAEINVTAVDGILADLGVSSPQLDDATRGFSFSKPGPLDMRMDPTRGPTALDLLNVLSASEIANVLFEFGEERHSRRIATALKEAATAGTLQSTTDVAAIVARIIPAKEQRMSKIHPATRTFQGLRIAVNTELGEIEQLLAAFPALLRTGGRCAMISFHSLEDRLVKHRFRELAWTSSLPPQYAAQSGERQHPVCTTVTKKPYAPTDAEVAENPRARSAKLRACERTEFPDEPTHSNAAARARMAALLERGTV